MFFVVNRVRLIKFIGLARDDRTPDQQGREGPFFRIEARGDWIKLTGRELVAELRATVYEPGVLFLRVTLFRRALRMLTGQKTIAIQVNADGLRLDNITFPLDNNDMLLYPDPAQAPDRHPAERLDREEHRRIRKTEFLFDPWPGESGSQEN